MKKISYIGLLIAAALTTSTTFADDNHVLKKIKARYKAAGEVITKCTNIPEEANFFEVCPIYHDTLQSNQEDGQVCGAGTHKITTDFWYQLSEEESCYGERRLIKVLQKEWIASVVYYREYLFDENQDLMFYFQKGGYEKVAIRLYFNKGQLIKSIPETPINTLGEPMQHDDIQGVLQRAENLKIKITI